MFFDIIISMGIINTIFVSISMAVDCMTISASDGIREPDMKKRKIFFIAFIFGLFQGLMPVIGYFLGYNFKEYLDPYIPWIAFTLLALLGIKNIAEWCKERFSKKKDDDSEEDKKDKKKLTVPAILIQGIATSIDALSIGFIYLDSSIIDAMLVFLIIGVTTFLLSLLTTFLGKKVGGWLEKWAGLIAGIVFIVIGVKILLEGILPSSSETVSALFSLINI